MFVQVLAFASFVSIEVAKDSLMLGGALAFHEFVVVTSWLFLMLFTVVAALRLYSIISIRGAVMKFVVRTNLIFLTEAQIKLLVVAEMAHEYCASTYVL